MDYRVETIKQLNVIGYHKSYKNGTEAQREIPKFWDEVISMQLETDLIHKSNQELNGLLGICIPKENGRMDYLIGVTSGDNLDDTYQQEALIAGDYLVVTVRGGIPEAIQRANRHIHSALLPNEDFTLKKGNFFELYLAGDVKSEDYISEIWLPIE